MHDVVSSISAGYDSFGNKYSLSLSICNIAK